MITSIAALSYACCIITSQPHVRVYQMLVRVTEIESGVKQFLKSVTFQTWS